MKAQGKLIREPMADASDTPPRTLQEFLGLYRWDESAMRDRLQQHVAGQHGQELTDLKVARDRGAIPAKEYEQQRAAILGRTK